MRVTEKCGGRSGEEKEEENEGGNWRRGKMRKRRIEGKGVE